MKRSWCSGLIFLLLGGNLSAASLTLVTVADTAIFDRNPDFNLGATSLLAGSNQLFQRGRSMFRFDMSAIPAGAVIDQVRVALYCTIRPDPDQHGGPTDSDFSLHRMLVSWGQGGGTNSSGSVAMAGDATWNQRHFGAITWGTPGGQSGLDYVEAASASAAVSNVGAYTWGSSTELIDDVNSWIADPSQNFGFMLISQGENSLGTGRRFASIEKSSALEPSARLLITYSVVPEPSSSLLVVTGILCFSLIRRRP